MSTDKDTPHAADRAGHEGQELPPAPPGAHFHVCIVPGCGAFIVCRSEHEHCPIGDRWACPTCELDALDAWIESCEIAGLLTPPVVVP